MTDMIENNYTMVMDDFNSLIVDRNKLQATGEVINAIPKYLRDKQLDEEGTLTTFGKWKRSVELRNEAEAEMKQLEEDKKQK